MTSPADLLPGPSPFKGMELPEVLKLFNSTPILEPPFGAALKLNTSSARDLKM